mgnify:CR=1 FL=1
MASKSRSVEILCAGFGGQGIIFMGKLLAQAGLNANRKVTWMPSYGVEVRGGTAYSVTKISEGDIASPIRTRPDIVVAMNRPSLEKYMPVLKEGGVLIANKTLVGDYDKPKGATVINAPLTDWAVKLGDVRIANIIAVGIVLGRVKLISMKHALGALDDLLKGKSELFLLNKKALERGFRL